MRGLVSFLFIVAAFVSPLLSAEVTPWEFNMESNILMSLNNYSDNWDGGEAGSFSWTAQLNAELQKQLLARLHNRTTLQVAFGQTKTQDGTSHKWSSPEKSTDKIDLETIFKFTTDKLVDPFAGVKLSSQFLDASDVNVDYYLNPIELSENFGAALNIVKKNNIDWTGRFGVSIRQLINKQPSIDNTNDGGLKLVTEFTATNKDNWLKYNSLLSIYEALISSNSDELTGDDADDWRYPDINWENTLTVNLNKYIMLNWYFELVYNRDVIADKNVKWKNIVSMALTYNITNKK